MPNRITRRAVIQGGLAAAATVPGPGRAAAAPTAARRKLASVGLITGTIRKSLQEDREGTLKKVAAIGYRELEFGGTFDLPAKECRKMLDGLGLKALAAGNAMKSLQASLDGMLETAQVLGQKYIVCYWPWTDSKSERTLDDWKALGAALNQIGKRVKSAGLTFAYHNHDIEFRPVAETIPYDVVIEHSDPALVTFQMDLYWVTKGGQNPVTYLERYPGRFSLFHVKDMAKDSDAMVCAGEGRVDFPAVFARAARAGVKHFIVEHDRPADPMACITQSYRYLSGLRF
jgi:sugar phosphate isomerase/epimerase